MFFKFLFVISYLCWVFSAAQGLSLAVVNKFLIAVAFLVAEHEL